MDMDGAESARPWIDAAGAEHPSLVDTAHQLDALFGVVNVPNVIWIDEEGTIVAAAGAGLAGAGAVPAVAVVAVGRAGPQGARGRRGRRA